MMNNRAIEILNEPNVFNKIALVRKYAEDLLKPSNTQTKINFMPSRDIPELHAKLHPAKKGFSTPEGQARLMHDLASIELQAMELGLRTLCEFSETAPVGFKEELLAVTLNESEHLEMCLMEIEKLGFKWGGWPVHLALWRATSSNDSLLDRILIVHRYLEGSGLDATDTFTRRLHLIDSPTVKLALNQISEEEIGHVDFGSRWYREICKLEKMDPVEDFVSRMDKLQTVLPKRCEPISVERRKKAGFIDSEIAYLQKLREQMVSGSKS